MKLSYTDDFVGRVLGSEVMTLNMSHILTIVVFVPVLVTAGLCLIQIIVVFLHSCCKLRCYERSIHCICILYRMVAAGKLYNVA